VVCKGCILYSVVQNVCLVLYSVLGVFCSVLEVHFVVC
jgi:hypothetical protein